MGPDSSATEILLEARAIAMIGASPDPERSAYSVMAYLLEQGYVVIPVRPGGGEILGCPVVGALADIDGPIDIVDVFRRADSAPGIARDAVAVGARSLWLQPGCISAEAGDIARAAGLGFVEDRCTRQAHRDEGLGPVGAPAP